MTYVLVRHKVKDFSIWKPQYDKHIPFNTEATLEELYFLRDISDPNDITILFKVTDLPKAQTYLASEELKLAMEKHGVIGQPDISFLED